MRLRLRLLEHIDLDFGIFLDGLRVLGRHAVHLVAQAELRLLAVEITVVVDPFVGIGIKLRLPTLPDHFFDVRSDCYDHVILDVAILQRP